MIVVPLGSTCKHIQSRLLGCTAGCKWQFGRLLHRHIQIVNLLPTWKKELTTRPLIIFYTSSFSFHLCSSTRALGLQEERGQTTCTELAGGKLIIVKHVHPWPFESVSSPAAFLCSSWNTCNPARTDREAAALIVSIWRKRKIRF